MSKVSVDLGTEDGGGARTRHDLGWKRLRSKGTTTIWIGGSGGTWAWLRFGTEIMEEQ